MEHDIRPWGQYWVLDDAATHKVKRILVDPEGRLSYQYHHHRSEAWTIVSGVGRITLDGDWTHIGHHTKLHRLGALGFILAHHVALVCGTTCQHGRCKNSTSDNTHGGRQDGHGITRFHSVMGVCETQAVQAASVGNVPYCTAPSMPHRLASSLGL